MRGALSRFLGVQKSETCSVRSLTIENLRRVYQVHQDATLRTNVIRQRRGCGLSYSAAAALCHDAAGVGARACAIEVLIESGIIDLIRFAEQIAACKAEPRDPHCALSAYWSTKRCGGCYLEEPNTDKEPPTRRAWHFRWQRIRGVSSVLTPQTGCYSIGCSNQLGLHSRRRQRPRYPC
jgi:hypothetical protein